MLKKSWNSREKNYLLYFETDNDKRDRKMPWQPQQVGVLSARNQRWWFPKSQFFGKSQRILPRLHVHVPRIRQKHLGTKLDRKTLRYSIYFSKITLNFFFFIFNFLDNCLTGHFIKKHNPWYCWMKHPEILYVFLYYKNIDVDCSIYLKGFFGGIFTYASVW